MPVWTLFAYAALAALFALVGGWTALNVRLSHVRMQLLLSFVGGAMLGVALLGLAPHAAYELSASVGWPRAALFSGAGVLGGFLLTFFLERILPSHHHEVAESDGEGGPACDHVHDHGHHHHHHEHAHAPAGGDAARPRPRLSWAPVLAGLAAHCLLDGAALAAAVVAESGQGAPLPALGVLLVVLLHKPFDSLMLLSLMRSAGRPAWQMHAVNGLFACFVPIGVLLFCLGLAGVGEARHLMMGLGLAAGAGAFLCIASSDLLPELQFHSHDRGLLSVALVAGLVVSGCLVYMEEQTHDHSAPGHNHDPGTAADPHAGHDHPTDENPYDRRRRELEQQR